MKNPSVGPFRITAKRRIYFSTVVFTALLFTLLMFYFAGRQGAGETLMLAIPLYILLNANLYLHELALDQHYLVYRRFIVWERRLCTQDIGGYNVRIGVFEYLDRFKPTVRMEIYSKSGDATIVIPVKVFQDSDIKALRQLLDQVV